jgi:transaldolase
VNVQTDEIMELAGCDFLTISPSLLDKLAKSNDKVTQHLSVESAKKVEPMEKVSYIDSEPQFRWELLQDQMAFDKLHEGIYKFAADAETLKDILKQHLQK